MRVIVYGAGAIGGVVACRLSESGHDVSVVARGAHLDVIRSSGLTLQTPDSLTSYRLEAAGDLVDLDLDPDPSSTVVMVAVKSQDSVAVLERVRSVLGPTTPVVCLQNGVDNERQALRRFERVYGVPVMCPASHLDPGVVQANSTPVTGIFDIGRIPSGVDDVAEEIAVAFAGSTFESVARPDIMRWKYSKLLLNLGNAIEALCDP
ncbi:MAG: ketopantoate reductase family protein, partial [Acidimicrobiales bacterium]